MNIQAEVPVGWRKIRTGVEYDGFFPRCEGDTISIKKDGAKIEDTLDLIRWVVAATLDDTKRIAKHLQAKSVMQTCRNIWEFCFNHFQYKKDEDRKEQIRRPARSWRDRIDGIDCDCLTVFIGSCLTNLRIPFIMRTTRYNLPEMEHIYPVCVVVKSDEGEIIMDCVVHRFNYEVPYVEKKDESMELQYLNGIEQERFNEFGDKVRFSHELPIDAEDLFGEEMEFREQFTGAEERAERQEERQEKREAKKSDPAPVKQKVKNALKKGVNVINKVNPATALLRAGLLAAMKLNLFEVASKLRFAYWSTAEAQKNNVDAVKFGELKAIREKLEKIYYNAGGKPEALKEAILTGKGNQDKMVQLSGLGAVVTNPSDEDSVRRIIGEDLFSSELAAFDGLHGLGNLGTVVATGAAVTAASGILASISGMLKKIGGIFKKGSVQEQKVQIKANTDAVAEKTRKFSVKNLVNKVKTRIQERRENRLLKKGETAQPGTGEATSGDTAADESMPQDEFSDGTFTDETMTDEGVTDESANVPAGNDNVDSRSAEDTGDGEKTGLVQWVKDNPVPATLIGVGILAAGYLTYRAVTKPKAALAGVPAGGKKRGRKGKKGHRKTGSKKNFIAEPVELL